jgi:hypothetical protein
VDRQRSTGILGHLGAGLLFSYPKGIVSGGFIVQSQEGRLLSKVLAKTHHCPVLAPHSLQVGGQLHIFCILGTCLSACWLLANPRDVVDDWVQHLRARALRGHSDCLDQVAVARPHAGP